MTGDIERKVEAENSDGVNNGGFFEATVERRQKLESKHFARHRDRVFYGKMRMEKVDDSIVLLINPFSPEGSRAVRASFFDSHRRSIRLGSNEVIEGTESVAIRLRKMRKGHVKLDLAIEQNLGANVSYEARLANVKQRLDLAANISIYFQRLIQLKDFTEDDGAAVAHDLIFNTVSSKGRVGRLPEVLEKNFALAELMKRYECFEPMMKKFLSGHLGISRAVGTKLICASEKEGTQLGKNGVAAIKSKKLASAGIYAWRVQNKPIEDLLEKYPALETMFVALASEVVTTAPWGLMWRVGIGALLSIVDIVTDISVTKSFNDTGEVSRRYDRFFWHISTLILSPLLLRCRRPFFGYGGKYRLVPSLADYVHNVAAQETGKNPGGEGALLCCCRNEDAKGRLQGRIGDGTREGHSSKSSPGDGRLQGHRALRRRNTIRGEDGMKEDEKYWWSEVF